MSVYANAHAAFLQEDMTNLAKLLGYKLEQFTIVFDQTYIHWEGYIGEIKVGGHFILESDFNPYFMNQKILQAFGFTLTIEGRPDTTYLKEAMAAYKHITNNLMVAVAAKRMKAMIDRDMSNPKKSINLSRIVEMIINDMSSRLTIEATEYIADKRRENETK